MAASSRINQDDSCANDIYQNGPSAADQAVADGYEGYEPLEMQYMSDIGKDCNNPAVHVTGEELFKETLKDTPCKFHDGKSGSCWKGTTCPYGHERYTGGQFAKENPSMELAANVSKRTTFSHISLLNPQTPLGKQFGLVATTTYVESPLEFYLEFPNEVKCACSELENLCKELKIRNDKDMVAFKEEHGTMDSYYHGFSTFETQEGFALPKPMQETSFSNVTMQQKLQSFLQTGLRYRNHQRSEYGIGFELVAVQLNMKWYRAYLLPWIIGDKKQVGGKLYRVHLLDSGERCIVNGKNICELPAQFCTSSPVPYRCVLHGVSPVFLVWTKKSKDFFKTLIEGQNLHVIVKDWDQEKDMFDPTNNKRYSVILQIKKEDGTYVDVADELWKEGYSSKWNPFPFRPHIKQFVNPDTFKFLNKEPPQDLPNEALKTENERMGRTK